MAKKKAEKPEVEITISNPKKEKVEESKEKKFDFKWLFLGITIIILLVVAVVLNINKTKNDATKITGTIDVDNGDEKINWDRYQTVDITLSESLKISESGTYHITGVLENGLIEIDAGVGEIRLLLDNSSISNTSGPAIACYSAEDLVIELEGDNSLSDGQSYSTDFDEDIDGVIYSKADIAFQGEGSLEITSNYQDAIVGKDDVKFKSGSYSITSNDDGIRGKDSVYIVNGNITIISKADAIKTTNETDTGKGFVLIEGGNLNITASGKGIESVDSMLIYDGEFSLNTYDDAIHSNNYIGIIGGNFNISSGDDGIHADRELIIDGGKVNISKAYEGLEAQAITINGGEISLVTSDDGINAGGGADSSATNRAGAGMFDADENCVLSINGGNVYVNSSGDGVDSNGWLYFNGGKVVVDGPTNNGNGALDAEMGIIMNGGEVIAIGSSGMAETLGNTSNVYNASIYLDATQPAKTKIEIKKRTGETVVEHTSAKSFIHIAVGTTNFNLGEIYELYIDGEKVQSFTISNITTTVGNNNTNQNMMPGNKRNNRK